MIDQTLVSLVRLRRLAAQLVSSLVSPLPSSEVFGPDWKRLPSISRVATGFEVA